MARCAGFKRNGERCTQEVTGEFCWAHDPENADQRRRRAARGGKAKANTEVKKLREQLRDLAEKVINGELETGRGAVANQIITTQIKLLEYERRSRDLDELVERLERLENARRAV